MLDSYYGSLRDATEPRFSVGCVSQCGWFFESLHCFAVSNLILVIVFGPARVVTCASPPSYLFVAQQYVILAQI